MEKAQVLLQLLLIVEENQKPEMLEVPGQGGKLCISVVRLAGRLDEVGRMKVEKR